ncbi:hypothetical protein ACMU_06065 [Actibacterium mucosum KCTC 23349]|uniref:N-acetyltransferase domain-containing protein n=1 Tax=Actibacterium mucosum KCTC 23349 TaxID=1454373 RepID=A0A037ZJA3_9RHOB|nr:hypothetical protein ACMU_06065 [Actibacterium mucosum KCTC 23349]
MTIRDATSGDAPAIAEIWNAEIRDGLSTFTTVEKTVAEIADRIRRGPCLVACDDRVRGFATYGPFRGGPGYAHTAEHTVYLSPDAQGQGAGRALMDALEHRAAQQGIHVLVGALSGTNSAGLRFHLARGYSQTGHMPHVGRKAGQWLDLVLVQKIVHLSP